MSLTKIMMAPDDGGSTSRLAPAKIRSMVCTLLLIWLCIGFVTWLYVGRTASLLWSAARYHDTSSKNERECAPFSFEFEEKKFTAAELKEAILHEIHNYHQDSRVRCKTTGLHMRTYISRSA